MGHLNVVLKFFAASTCLWMSACVTKPVFVIDPDAGQATPRSSINVTVIDKRPTDDRESSMGSLAVTSDRYGIYILGDERFVPTPATALTNRVGRIFARELRRPSTVTITLNRFNTQNNAQAAMRHSAIDAGLRASLTPLGIALVDAVLPKLRAENIDIRKPFVLTYAQATVELKWPDNTRTTRNITVVKANNYSETNIEEQKAMVAKTASAALDELVTNIRTAGMR